MTKKIVSALLLGSICLAASTQAQSTQQISVTRLGNLPLDNSEIVSYAANRAYSTNAISNTIDVIDLTIPTTPVLLFQIQLSTFGGVVNSVSVKNGVIAAAVEANVKQEPGKIVFFDATSGALLGQVTVGALPDMVTFTPNGQYVLCANEGEPNDDYTVDPEGSVSVIDLRNGVANATVSTASFAEFNNGQPRNAELPTTVRIFGPNATVAQDLEPEYITVSSDSSKAYVTLQENNAIAVINIANAQVERIDALGFKDHNQAANGLDASDKDSGINIKNWPIWGMYQPDTIASYTYNGISYLATANEGDARDYGGFSEVVRIKNRTLNPVTFPDAATLKQDANLGRLNTTSTLGNTDGNPADIEQLFSFGARSFSIWNGATGQLVFDSGDQFEQIIAAQTPALFNQNGPGNFDQRSDDKGAEPEALDLAFVGGRVYALVGLERVGGMMIYDVTNPTAPEFLLYEPAATINGITDDGPEGIKFVAAANSPTQQPLVLIAHEISNNLAVYQLNVCTVSALNFVNTTLNITGHCLDNGVDIYQRLNNVLTLIQANVVVNGQAAITVVNPLPSAEYFAAVAGQTTPINGIVAIPAAVNTPTQPIPTLSTLGLWLMMLLMPVVAAVGRRR